MSLHFYYNSENDTYGAFGNSIHKQYFKKACSKEEMILWMEKMAIPYADNFSKIPIQNVEFVISELRSTYDDFEGIKKCLDIGISEKKLGEVIWI